MKTRTSIILLLILLFIPVCYADTILNEPFDYSDDYANHGWSFTGSAFYTSYPIPSPYGSNAFGVTGKNPFGSGVTESIVYIFETSLDSGVINLFYEIDVKNNSINSQGVFTNQIYVNSSNPNQRLTTRVTPSGTSMNLTLWYSAIPLCGNIISSTQQNFSGNIMLIVDISSEEGSLYFNGTVLPSCSQIDVNPMGSRLNISKFDFQITADTAEYIEAYIDNIAITQNGAAGILAAAGEPCTDAAECDSGKCEYGACVLKQVGVACTHSSQCASGDCKNGLCTKASLSQNLEQSKNELFGSDSMTANIISLFIMIGLAIVIMIAGSGSSIAVIAGLFIFVALAFLFTLMHWLSPFILLGVIICLLVLIVLMFVMGGSSN